MRSVLLSDDLDTIMDASSAATTTTPDAWDGAHSHRRPELRKHKTMKTIDELVADHKALENRVPNRPIQNDAKSGNQQTNNSKAFQMLRDYEMATSILESRNRADFARRRPHIAFENQRIKLDKTFRTAPGGVKLQLDMAIPEEDDDDNTVRRVLRSQSTALLNKDMNTMMSSSSSGNDSSRDNDSGRQARKKKTVSFQDETPSSTLSTLSTPPSPFALPVDDVHSAAGRRQQQHHMDQSRCDDDGTGQGNGHISSPIHAACYKGDHVTVQHLLGHYSAHEATKLVNSLCTCGMTPLQVACDQGHARVAKFLLRRQARVDARSSSRPHSSGSNSPVSPPSGFAAMGVGKKRHRSCLALAASRRSLDSIELLLDNGAKLDEDALVTACSLGDTAIVHALVQSTAKKFAGFDKLWTPSSSNSSNSSDSTLDPSWIANAAAIAVVNAHAPVLNVLLGDGQSAASRARITTCALDAAAVADYKLLRFLTKVYDHALLKPAHDAHGNSLLHLAVKQASTKCVTLLIRLGVDVDARDALGITPLYMACARGQHAIVRLLVHAGAACVRMGPNDETPLHIAAQENHLSCVSLLLADAHAPVDATTLDKCTALHLACQRGNTLVAKCLLDHGADVNARTVCDETPLLKASRMNNMETVKLLLARNAEIATSSTSSLSSCDESVAHQYEPVTASTSSSVFSTGRSDGGVDTHSGRRSVISLAPTTNNQLPPPPPAHAHQPTPLTRSTSKDKDGQDKSHAHSIKGWFKSVVKGHKH